MSKRQDPDEEEQQQAGPSQDKKSRKSDSDRQGRQSLRDYLQSRSLGTSSSDILQSAEPRDVVSMDSAFPDFPCGSQADFTTVPHRTPVLDIFLENTEASTSSLDLPPANAPIQPQPNQEAPPTLSARPQPPLQLQHPDLPDLPTDSVVDIECQDNSAVQALSEVNVEVCSRMDFTRETVDINSVLAHCEAGNVLEFSVTGLPLLDQVLNCAERDQAIDEPIPSDVDFCPLIPGDFDRFEDTEEDSNSLQENAPLYEGATITLHESLIAVLTFYQTESLSGKALERLIALMQLHLPKPNSFPNSMHNFFTRLNCEDLPVFVYYYCTVCLKECASASDSCPKCQSKIISFFIHMPIEPQIQKKFVRSGFSESLNYKDHRKKINEANIEDIFDSAVFQKILERNPSLRGKVLTLTWNTDGAAPYNSSSYGLWPVYYVINELPPKERFKKENMILGGLWGGHTKPCPNIFLRPAYVELKRLRSDGMDVKLPNGETVNYKVVVVCGTCDTPAKALFFNIKGHSGYDSCPKCHVKGEKSPRTEDVLVFPYEPTVLRTEENYLQDVMTAVQTKEESNGVKGPTLLFYMVELMLESTSIDSMHAVYLGACKQILKLLFSESYSKATFSLHKHVDEVNRRIRAIRLPNFAERYLLDVDKLPFWKRSLLRAFFMLCSLF